jgi:hypothetical protein
MIGSIGSDDLERIDKLKKIGRAPKKCVKKKEE